MRTGSSSSHSSSSHSSRSSSSHSRSSSHSHSSYRPSNSRGGTYGRGYRTRRNRGSLLGSALSIVLFIFIAIISNIIDLISDGVDNAHIDRIYGYEYSDDNIIDQLSLINDSQEAEIKEVIREYYDKTGVQIYLGTKDISANPDAFLTDEARTDYTVNTFNNSGFADNVLLIIYFDDTSNTKLDGYLHTCVGDEAEAVFSVGAENRFYDNYYSNVYDKPATTFVKGMSTCISKIDNSNPIAKVGKTLLGIFVIFVFIIIGIIIIVCMVKSKKKKNDVESIPNVPRQNTYHNGHADDCNYKKFEKAQERFDRQKVDEVKDANARYKQLAKSAKEEGYDL